MDNTGCLWQCNRSVSAIPPPKPINFHGRDDYVDRLATTVLESPSNHVAILGTGGIGKTSVALALLHDERIHARFNDRRYFFSCESAANADTIIESLTSMLSLPGTASNLMDQLIQHLQLLPPTMLVLDNLETVWLTKDDKNCADTEHLLQMLSIVGNLSLVITSRGTVVPHGVHWANQRSAELTPISLEAARQTFLGEAQCDYSDDELAALGVLLSAVDCMPLAVSLLAQLAQTGQKPSCLLLQWETVNSTFIQTAETGRQRNVNVSIQLSIQLLPSDDQQPLELLAVCSHLPDGISDATLRKIADLGQFVNIYGSTLR